MTLIRRHILLALGFLLLLPINLWSYTPYTTRELDELEKEFIEQINQAGNVIRVPLANQYINHLGEILARNGQLPQPVFSWLTLVKSMHLQDQVAILA